MWVSLSSQRSIYQQFAVLELPGISTYRFSVRVRNAASLGNGIGVAQFGERFTNRGPFKSSANTVSPSVLFKCRPKNASRSAPSKRKCRSEEHTSELQSHVN